MGCCQSKAEELYIDVPRSISTTDAYVLRQADFLDGCQLLPSTAACPASFPYQCLPRVVVGDGHVFAALWEGQGGAQAARHCVAHCYEVLQQCLADSPSNPPAALQQAMKQLDQTYLASDLPDMTKACVGATGVMLLLDTRSHTCYTARLGSAMPFVAASKGAFSNTSVDVKHLAATDAGVGAGSRARRQAGGSSSMAAAQQQRQQDTALGGLTHAIGLGYGKQERYRKVWEQQQGGRASGSPPGRKGRLQAAEVPRVSNKCEIMVTQLSPGDDNLVIAAEGLLAVSPPREIATLLQHFSAARLADIQHAFCSIREQQLELQRDQQQPQQQRDKQQGSKGRGASSRPKPEIEADEAPPVGDVGSALSVHPNVASIVMHQAMAKALNRFNTALVRHRQEQQQQEAAAVAEGGQSKRPQQQQQGQCEEALQPLTYDELAHLPLCVDKEAFRPQGPAGSEVLLLLPDDYPTGGLSKADVHGDMSLVVIALGRPRPADSLAAGPLVTPLRPGPRALTRRPQAEWRWTLLRLAVRAHLAYRRALRTTWWRLVDEVQEAAEAAARQAEVHAWKTAGAAVKVNLAGAMVQPQEPVSFLRAHHTPPGKAGFRQASSSGASHTSSTAAAAAAAAASVTPPHAMTGFPAESSTAGRAAFSQGGGLPDIGARAPRSSSGVGGSGASPHAGVHSLRGGSGSSGVKAAPRGSNGAGKAHHGAAGGPPRYELSLSAVHSRLTEDNDDGGDEDDEELDTASDLDSPSKLRASGGPDSPSRRASSKACPPWETHAPGGGSGGSSRGDGGRAAGGWGAERGSPRTPSSSSRTHHQLGASPGSSSAGWGTAGCRGAGGGSSSGHGKQGLSLRGSSRTPAAAGGGAFRAASPATSEASYGGRAAVGGSGGGRTPAGTTPSGLRAGSGAAAGVAASSPARRDKEALSLRARKPAARW